MAAKTNVFISWSGDLSKRLGQAVGEWLQDALQFIEPFFTPDHVDKGTKWLPEISVKLEACDCAILCLTTENLSSPWILFEAGALSKRERSRVCTLLFDVAKTDVEFPLAMFQATDFAKDDFRKLFETVNNTGGDLSLKESALTRAFDKWWPDLEEKVNAIRAEHQPGTRDATRPTEEMVKEILELTRSLVRGERTRSQPGDEEDFWKDKLESWAFIERLKQDARLAEELERDSSVPRVPSVPKGRVRVVSKASRSTVSSSGGASSSSSSVSPKPSASPPGPLGIL